MVKKFCEPFRDSFKYFDKIVSFALVFLLLHFTNCLVGLFGANAADVVFRDTTCERGWCKMRKCEFSKALGPLWGELFFGTVM